MLSGPSACMPNTGAGRDVCCLARYFDMRVELAKLARNMHFELKMCTVGNRVIS